jgi:hypothetical protein
MDHPRGTEWEVEGSKDREEEGHGDGDGKRRGIEHLKVATKTVEC